jgi:hypothetical protein
MTKSELFQQLTVAGLYPIPVQGGIDEQHVKGMQFAGDTLRFIEAAKALASHCVFVASRALAEADFVFPAEGDGVDDPPGAEPKAIDLVTVEPKLGEFKPHLGQDCGHRLWVAVGRTTLEHLILLPWWERFAELREGAIAALVRTRDAAWAKQAEDEQQQRDALVERLRGLIADPQFIKQTTQIAMQAYAVEQIPELESLGDKTLRAEIQALDAKIKARGLRGKK